MKFKNIKKKTYKKKSPSNSRSIPDFAKDSSGKPALFKLFLPKLNHAVLLNLYHDVLKIFVVFIFVVAAIIVGFDFWNNLWTSQKIEAQRITLTKELTYWKNFISQHQNFPDAYFQASSLEYQLGDTTQAKIDVEKGLALDPNSQNGKKIEDFLNK